MPYKVASRQEFDDFCHKHKSCSACTINICFPFCGRGHYIADDSLEAREWATMVMECELNADEERRNSHGGD